MPERTLLRKMLAFSTPTGVALQACNRGLDGRVGLEGLIASEFDVLLWPTHIVRLSF
ncbi:protein of unknown function [Hyphomicrobium sp. MC1]|nr:protein of unknown function [Hyphomicrobium sp. MC1]